MRALLLLCSWVVQLTTVYGRDQYLGCFIDRAIRRDLEFFIGEYEQLSPKQCILACQGREFRYAAIQNGGECRCGQEYGKYGRVPDVQCDHSCATAEKCGGHDRNSIYSVLTSDESSVTDSRCTNTVVGYHGCFDDAILDIAMPTVNSIEKCLSYCATNYNYAGVMNGNLCRCGNRLHQSSVNSVLCNIPCHGNQQETEVNCCGGLGQLSVFDVKNYQLALSDDAAEARIRVKRAGKRVRQDSFVENVAKLGFV